ncbi:MAG: valine--tRNA ligase [Acidibrevibacterium sp.]|uniref:valine--tRNA ligase n=1 Tax=Acidibrevibacterium sp. TaxID=2606776 RepID=UPI003D088BFB
MPEHDRLDKSFSPNAAEARLYDLWETSGAFAAVPESDKRPFTIMIPPPNVTGSLHMGHALTFTLQDVLIRWKRMAGFDALWQPGTDHAGIATQMVVERLLAAEGTSRKELGREKFLERVWQWKAESGGQITQQLRRLGASLDWQRERFTLDEGLSAAVRKVFVKLYREKLIYRAHRLVNWDPKLQTAISDLEVENREIKGHLWYIRYPIAGENGRFITVATTRPETILGDVAVAVHPEDARYRDLIGRSAHLPLVDREIPIIADEYVDREKGTGAVKITPAHDFNDFKLGERHRLPMPSVLDRLARVSLAGLRQLHRDLPGFVGELDGKDRFEARALIVERLKVIDLLEKTEPHTHQVPHGDRSGVVIEPLLTWQWFADAKVLAKAAIEAVEQGETRFVPEQWQNTFFAWMREIEPWCISRQLWWGHRIPAWYGPKGEIFVAETEEEAREHFGIDAKIYQDEDVLDTWFSSALWPFSTLGWPEETKELKRYYPTDVLVTGFDIIFFWVARMMMMGHHFMGDVPFRDVYIHGLVRDERGQKMSKSKGNVIDPLALIDEFGADALRFTICAAAGPGRDIKLGRSRVESQRSFVTKLWNAARFCEMNGIAPVADFDPAQAQHRLSRWILDAADSAIAEATKALEAYRFDDYAQVCYRFLWNTYCDWFLEFIKPSLAENADETREFRAVAAYVLGVILRLLHPVMPFVTETLWHHFGFGAEGSLIRAAWPTGSGRERSESHRDVERAIALISEIRATRAALNVPPSRQIPLFYPQISFSIFMGWESEIRRLGRISDITLIEGDPPAGCVQIAIDNGATKAFLQLTDVIDLDAERARLRKKRDEAKAEWERHFRKLSNADFTKRAPPEIIEETQAKMSAAGAEGRAIEEALARIGG